MLWPPLLGSVQKQQKFHGIGVLWSGYKGIVEEFCIKSLACTKCWWLNWRLFLDLVSCYYVMLKFDFLFSTFIIRIILPKKNLVHRDLAARNVLVGRDNRVKVSDFGLMRQIYEDVNSSGKCKKLFIKWMAPESLYQATFTIKSDEWVE